MRIPTLKTIAFTVCLTLALPVYSRAGKSDSSCEAMLLIVELEKTALNATLFLPQGAKFPDELVQQFQIAAKCPDGGAINMGSAGELPSCSKHGQLSWKQYIQLLTFDVQDDSGGEEDYVLVAQAAYALAKYYGNPKAKQYDLAKAIRYAEKSAAKNFAPAQFLLSYSYTVGHGVTQDEAKALGLLEAAAAQEFVPAVEELRKRKTKQSGQPAPTAASGTSAAPAKESAADRLRAAKKLLDDGLISPDEYESARKRILGEL